MLLKDKGINGLYIDENIKEKIIVENKFQLTKWGFQEHEIYKWMNIIHEEIGEFDKAILEFEVFISKCNYMPPDVMLKHELIQIITLYMKLYKMIDEYDGEGSFP